MLLGTCRIPLFFPESESTRILACSIPFSAAFVTGCFLRTSRGAGKEQCSLASFRNAIVLWTQDTNAERPLQEPASSLCCFYSQTFELRYDDACSLFGCSRRLLRRIQIRYGHADADALPWTGMEVLSKMPLRLPGPPEPSL